MASKTKVIALDLEGTLISTVGTQMARPGLYKFLEFCKEKFERVVIFTAVDEDEFRPVAENLVKNRYAPIWFENIEYVHWDGEKKDLGFIPAIQPNEAMLVDDYECFVAKDQKAQWIEIDSFDYPFPKDDNELERVMQLLLTKID